jgi:hypothetical protein
MKKFALSLAAVALVGFTAGSASAQCEFNALAKAKGLKSTVVRAFAECPSTQHPTENSTTQSGTAACEPVTPKDIDGVSTYQFTEKGGCQLSSSGAIEPDCSELTASDGSNLGMPSGPCHVVTLKGKCKGIVGADGVSPISSEDGVWTLATLSRASLNDPVTGDVTVIDFPVTFEFDTPSKGGLKLSGNSAEALAGLLDPASAALPTCTQIEIVRITVKDGTGAPFARLGVGTAAKGEGGPAGP